MTAIRANLKTLGETPQGSIAPERPAEPVVVYPKIVLNSKQLEGIEDLKNGETVYLVLEAEVESSGKGEREYGDAESESHWAKFCLKRGKINEERTTDEVHQRMMEEQHDIQKKPMSEILRG